MATLKKIVEGKCCQGWGGWIGGNWSSHTLLMEV